MVLCSRIPLVLSAYFPYVHIKIIEWVQVDLVNEQFLNLRTKEFFVLLPFWKTETSASVWA